MHLNQGKLFPLFFSLLLICSSLVSAQDKQLQPAPVRELNLSKPTTEEPADALMASPPFSEASEIDDSKPKADRNTMVESGYQSNINSNEYRFRLIESRKRHFDFDNRSINEMKRFGFLEDAKAKSDDIEPRYVRETAPGRGFNYTGAFKQSLLFLGVQHGYAILGQAKTRRALKHGPFFKDYVDSVKSLHGWDDGGRFFTNYIAHPMQGALTGHVYVQNSPQALREEFSMSPKYWETRMKAMLWTTAWSTQFEIGPISQASIGNVGLKGKQTWEDIVVTPTAGTVMLIAEDALDRYAVKYIERRTNNRYVKVFARMLLNPTRNFSNMLRFREPWYRDRPAAR